MELFDTHAHFEHPTADEIAAVLARARDAGVTRVMAVGGSDALNRGAQAAPTPYKAIGWDRDQAGKELPPLDYNGIAAVGEIGLDYHYSPETRAAQIDLFARQLELSKTLDLPVVIHTRDADDDTLGVLREIRPRGIIHSFTGSPSFGRALLDLGFFISLSGIVTFRAADNVRETARVIPDDRLLIETDTPFLAPVPKRGQANEPAFVAHTARFLAELRQTTLERLAAITTGNALKVLGKAAIRREMRAKRRDFLTQRRRGAEDAAAIADQIAAACASHVSHLPSIIAVYLATDEEIDLTAFIQQGLAEGRTFAAPRWNGTTYELAELTSLEPSALRKGPMNVWEPSADAAVVLPRDVGLWLVPGLAFTPDGQRLGYGGGWYDRLLARAAPTARKLGVAFPFQMVPDLPSAATDIRLDGVVAVATDE